MDERRVLTARQTLLKKYLEEIAELKEQLARAKVRSLLQTPRVSGQMGLMMSHKHFWFGRAGDEFLEGSEQLWLLLVVFVSAKGRCRYGCASGRSPRPEEHRFAKKQAEE